jgi:hypothetical protein
MPGNHASEVSIRIASGKLYNSDMSVEQLESAIKALAPEERERFAGWFDEHRHELVRRRKVEEAQQREILDRLHEVEKNPKILEAFEENDLERLIQDVTSKKTPSRPR